MLNNIATLYGTGVSTPANNYISIQSATVDSGGASTITFSSIPSTYTHLQLRYIALGSAGGGNMLFNSDSATNYSRHYLEGNGSTASAGASTSTAGMGIMGGSGTANVAEVGIIDILDYTNTSKYKTVRELAGLDINGAGGFIDFFSGNWRSTSAISSITINASTTYSQYSQFALYGVK